MLSETTVAWISMVICQLEFDSLIKSISIGKHQCFCRSIISEKPRKQCVLVTCIETHRTGIWNIVVVNFFGSLRPSGLALHNGV